MAPSADESWNSVEVKMAPTDTSPSQLWTIQDIPNKNQGLIATTYIAPGTPILSEAPILDTSVITTFDADIIESELLSALQKLSPTDQDRYRSLHNNFATSDPTHPLSGIVKSNGYPLGDSGIGGVFADIARINHSCRPNAVQYWDATLEKQTIYAVRPIREGEEVTVTYIHSLGPSEARRAKLKEDFDFDCRCELCGLSEAQLKESDERLARAEELDAKIGDAKLCNLYPAEVIKAGRELFEIYEKEDVKDGRLSRLYYDVFQVCNMHSDLARARCFAKYYVDAKKMAEGKNSEDVLKMEPVVRDPRKHKDSFEGGGMWKSGLKDVPKGMKPGQFAKWLWREDI